MVRKIDIETQGPIPALDAEQPRTVVAHLPTPERSASPELRPTQRSLSSTTALDYRNAGAGSHENNSQSADVDSEGPGSSESPLSVLAFVNLAVSQILLPQDLRYVHRIPLSPYRVSIHLSSAFLRWRSQLEDYP